MDLRPAQSYKLPEGLRDELAKPYGPVVPTEGVARALHGVKVILAVGDVVSMTLKEADIAPQVFVCDYKTQRGGESELYRRELGGWGAREIKVTNPPATITREAWDAVREALASPQSPVRIVVAGEEDLLGIPCFLEAPTGAAVLYGMPGKGVVVVRVDDAFKGRVAHLLGKFL